LSLTSSSFRYLKALGSAAIKGIPTLSLTYKFVAPVPPPNPSRDMKSTPASTSISISFSTFPQPILAPIEHHPIFF
jgi:hypothetical protein